MALFQIKDVTNIDNFTPKYELKEFDVKSLAIVPMHNNAHVVGVIVIENYKEKTWKIARRVWQFQDGINGYDKTRQRSNLQFKTQSFNSKRTN